MFRSKAASVRSSPGATTSRNRAAKNWTKQESLLSWIRCSAWVCRRNRRNRVHAADTPCTPETTSPSCFSAERAFRRRTPGRVLLQSHSQRACSGSNGHLTPVRQRHTQDNREPCLRTAGSGRRPKKRRMIPCEVREAHRTPHMNGRRSHRRWTSPKFETLALPVR